MAGRVRLCKSGTKDFTFTFWCHAVQWTWPTYPL